MITLEQFKVIFATIQDLEDGNEQLGKILLCNEGGGWISYGEKMIDSIFYLLNATFDIDPDDDLFFWWLYDISDGNKFCYDKGIKYDLNSLDDLYYYATKQYDKVKQSKDDKREKTYTTETVTVEEFMSMMEGKFNNDKRD